MAQKQFELVSEFGPKGDQERAIEKLSEGLERGLKRQTLLGVTGSGKTFTVANVIARAQRPTLVIAHNKTLAAQLTGEFREFFPNNAVCYFVSYYDYYQPEAYLPATDTYIEKDSSINEEIDRLRHFATQALYERRDVIIVASVSCIYGLGSPEEYASFSFTVEKGDSYDRDRLLRRLVDMRFERNDINLTRGHFRVRGDVLEILPVDEDRITRVEMFGDEIERILAVDPVTGEVQDELERAMVFPASHYVSSLERQEQALRTIEEELQERLEFFRRREMLLEAQRLEQRTRVRPRDDPRDRVLPGDRELLAALRRARAGAAAVHTAGLFPGGFPGGNGRKPPDRAADSRATRGGSFAEAVAGRARFPVAVGL